MKTLPAAWIMAHKDLRAFFRDRTGMLLGFLLPLVLCVVFGFVMKAAFSGNRGVPKIGMAVIDADQSEPSQAVVKQLEASDMLAVKRPETVGAESLEVARQLIRDGEQHHVLVIAKGFGGGSAEEQLSGLVMIRDPGREMEDQVIRGAMMQAYLSSGNTALWTTSALRLGQKWGMTSEELEQLSSASRGLEKVITEYIEKAESTDAASGGAGEPKPAQAAISFDFLQDMLPIHSEDIAPPDRPKGLSQMLAQSISGITVMMLMFGMMGCAAVLLQEREGGTLRRLISLPVPRSSILLGKFLYTGIVGLLQLAVLFVVGNLIFRVGAFRDPVTLTVLSLTWLSAATSFGIAIAAWAQTTKQAEGISTLLILVMAALGGCWFPVQIATIPAFAQAIIKLTPTYWAMSGYQGMFWDSLRWTHPRLLTAITVQLGFTAVMSAIAILFFRRRYVAG